MNQPYHYKQTGELWGVYNRAGVIQEPCVSEETARWLTEIKNAHAMNELERHNATYKAKKTLERLLSHPKFTEAADAALLLTKGTGMIEVKNEEDVAIYILIFNLQHTGRVNRKMRPRFSPLFIKGQIPESPVIDEIRLFNDRFGK